MGSPVRHAGHHREHRLGPVECLHLALFVNLAGHPHSPTYAKTATGPSVFIVGCYLPEDVGFLLVERLVVSA